MNEYWDQGWENRFNRTDHVFYKNESADELRDRIQKNVDEVILNNEHAITETLPIKEKVILNVGCGLDEAPAFMLLSAKNYIGIDYSYNAAKYSLETIKKLIVFPEIIYTRKIGEIIDRIITKISKFRIVFIFIPFLN